jgi:hypothetical protein
VHRNGVTLDTSEYTASNGTSIVLAVAAGTGDIVDIIAFKSFTVADALSAVSGGTVNGGVNITGNVGIGTASPTDRLDIRFASGTGNLKAGVTAGNNIKIYNSAGDLSIATSDSASDAILDSQRSVIFKTANTERMRVNAGAPILCLSGGSTTATGTGIAFPAVLNASSDVNTLDDYEEGTYTPTVSYSGSTSGVTYTSRTGSFTKIGNVISVQIAIACSSKGTGSGSVVVSLPFANKTERAGLAIGNTQGISANNSSYQAMIESGLSNVYFRVPSGLGSTTELGYADIANNFYIAMSGVYLIS